MERPIFKPIGTAEEELDTPALVVDLGKLNRNIETMASFFKNSKAKLRPRIAAHGSPAIAHMQLAAGGTVGGITTTTLGQAEVFAANGFTDVFISNIVVGPVKIQSLCALAKRIKVTVAVDSSKNVRDLAEAATSSHVTLNLVVDVNTRPGRTGVEPGTPALELARVINNAKGLEFVGLSTHEGTILSDKDLSTIAEAFGVKIGVLGDEILATESRQWIQRVLDTRQDIEKAGIDVNVVSIGGTYNYEIAGEMDGVTEVPAGSYALMDEKYRQHRKEFVNAARIMSCVTSLPESSYVVTDAGRKAVGADSGNPHVDYPSGGKVRFVSAEHGSIDFHQKTNHGLKLGDRVWFIPWNIAGSVNIHDYMFAIREGKLEAIWNLPARGRYR